MKGRWSHREKEWNTCEVICLIQHCKRFHPTESKPEDEPMQKLQVEGNFMQSNIRVGWEEWQQVTDGIE